MDVAGAGSGGPEGSGDAPASPDAHDLDVVQVAEGTTVVARAAYRYETDITGIVLPPSLTTIRDHAFGGCSRISTLQLPEGLTVIGDSAFRGCTGIIDLQLPAGIKSIGAILPPSPPP